MKYFFTDDGSGKWPYAGSIEAAKALGANTVEKVFLPLEFVYMK